MCLSRTGGAGKRVSRYDRALPRTSGALGKVSSDLVSVINTAGTNSSMVSGKQAVAHGNTNYMFRYFRELSGS